MKVSAGLLTRGEIANPDEMGLRPRPLICGKMNYTSSAPSLFQRAIPGARFEHWRIGPGQTIQIVRGRRLGGLNNWSP